jgi:hypothetical protein
VFNDDGSGEVTDLCKNAHNGKVSEDIRNFYTLCGEAQKSVSIKHRGILDAALGAM